MTDAAPVNRYLLFSRSNDFRTADKVRYALQHDSLLPSSSSGTAYVGGSSLAHDLERRILIKSVDDVKRHFLFGERAVPQTPATGSSVTFSAVCDPAAALEELDSSNTGVAGLASPFPKLADDGLENSPILLEEAAQDIDTKPWDDPGAKGNYWNWPIESLYQNYHLVLAIDFGQASFDVSENGTIFIDRVPSIVESLLHVLRTTIETREEDVAHCRRWLQANVVDERLRTDILTQLWNPKIQVSIFMLNAPHPPSDAAMHTVLAPFRPFAAPPAPRSAAHKTTVSSTGPTRRPEGGESANVTDDAAVHSHSPPSGGIVLFPTEHAPTSFACTPDAGVDQGSSSSLSPPSSCTSCIPLVTSCDARWLLADETFLPHLQEALLNYENMCRQGGPAVLQRWPQSSLSGSLEYLIRTTPECTEECYSIVLVNNTAALECTDSLSFLESAVRRKNIILSVVSLNRRTHFDSAELSPLSQFLFTVGGFAVHVDYWLAMAATRLNRDWCHRFEGARCVAQQLFVHLVGAFPVSSHGITAGAALLPEKETSVVLYDGEHDLPDQIWSGPTVTLVRAIAGSRFNEGWSILIDYKDESTEAIVLARRHHSFHSGSLTLHYELRVNRPVVYRQVRLTGTKALVDLFHRLHLDAAWREQSLHDAGASWFVTLSILQAQLESWMRSEQVLLQLLENPTRFKLHRDLYALTNTRGVAGAWVNVCSITAISILVQCEKSVLCPTLAHMSPALSRCTNSGVPSAAWGCATASWSVLQAAMLREGHVPLADSDCLTFVRLGSDGLPVYVVQCLPFADATERSRASAVCGGGSKGTVGGAVNVGGSSGSGVTAGSLGSPVLLATGFECRLSFFPSTTAAEEEAVVRELVERLNRTHEGGSASAAKADTTPSAEAGKKATGAEKRQRNDGRRLLLRATRDPQSLLLVEMVTHRRTFTLLANMSYLRVHPTTLPPPTALSLVDSQNRARVENDPLLVFHAPSTGTASSGTSRSGAGGNTPAGGDSVLQYFRRAGRVPYAVAPAHLLEMYVASWTFGSSETFPDFDFAEETFFFAVLRRLMRGFTLLYCSATSLKAIMHASRPFEHWSGTCTASIHDVVEVREAPTGTDGSIPGRLLSIQRCISPHFYAKLQPQAALCDIREDFHVATALQSYRACATLHDRATPLRSPLSLRAGQRAGTLLTSVHLESLVRYLSPAHSTCVALTSPPSLRDDRGTDLRGRLMELLRNLGERSASISATQFSEEYVKLLTRGTEPVPRHYRIQTSILAPLRNRTITALLILETDTPTGAQTHTVTVVIASMDLALLRYGLVRQYAPSYAQALPEWRIDRIVLQSLQHLLLTFTSLHTTQQLIHRLNHAPTSEDGTTASPSAQSVLKRRQLEEEIMKSYSFMRTYTYEVDVTHLLHTLRLKPAPSVTLPAVVQQTLAALLDSFTTHATGRSELFFPFSGKGTVSPTAAAATLAGLDESESPAPSAGTLPLGCSPPHPLSSPPTIPNTAAAAVDGERLSIPSEYGLPMVLRVAAILSTASDKSAPTTTFWVSKQGPSHEAPSLADTGSAVPPTAEVLYSGRGGASDGPATSSPSTATLPSVHPSQQRLRVRLFIKTLPREVSSLFRGSNANGFNLSQAPVRELLHTLIVRYSSGRPGIAADPMDADFSATGRVISEKDVDRMQGLCTETGDVGEPLERILKGLQTRFITTVARYCMTRAFRTAAFQRLKVLVLSPTVADSDSASMASGSAPGTARGVSKGVAASWENGEAPTTPSADREGGESQMPRREPTSAIPAPTAAVAGATTASGPTSSTATPRVSSPMTTTTIAGVASSSSTVLSPQSGTASAPGRPADKRLATRYASVPFGDLSYLAQTSAAAPRAMREDKELASLLRRVVLPSLLSSKLFVEDSFPVTFTQQATDFRSIDPVTATTDVFRRCVEEDNMGVVAVAHHLSYAYVPSAAFFGERWIAVLVEPTSPDGAKSNASILCYEPAVPPYPEEQLGAAGAPDGDDEAGDDHHGTVLAAESSMTTCETTGSAVSALAAAAAATKPTGALSSNTHSALQVVTEKLRSHIKAKVTQVSQLHLLRQLRDTQFANAELIPDSWGSQFRSLTFATTRMSEDAQMAATSLSLDPGASQFYLQGSNVLHIPIYYKLQHQCKRVLQRITANSSRLELIQIFNRDQCFVVADDVEGDTFHYIRLVFSKDTGTTTSVSTFPPQVVGTDRHSKLVVQLFTATTNASVKRPLQKLQDFCYFLAVQELQGHVNYVQHKMISFNDLVFLQNQKLEPITLDLREILKANAATTSAQVINETDPPDDVSNDNITAFAMALLFLNLRDNKFKLFEVQRDQSHAVSNFVEHYNLEEGLRSDGTDGTTPATTTDGALRFVKLVDGLTDVLVSCAIVPDRARCAIVVERYTTKVPSERYTSGESESSILKQLDSYVNDTITQLHFYAQTLLSQHTTPHAVPALVQSLLTTSRAMRSTESLFLRYAHLGLDEVCPSVYPFLLERLCGALSAFDPCCLQVVPRADACDDSVPQADCVDGFPWRWKEWLQNEPRVDEASFYVVCGFCVEADAATSTGVRVSPTTADAPDTKGRRQKYGGTGSSHGGSNGRRTRVIPYVRRDLLVSTTTTEESHGALLAELGLARKKKCKAYITLNVSLNEGIHVAVFNLRDTDFLLRLLTDVVQEMEVKSTLLNDILLQRLGYSIPSAFDEAGLARNCCGDATNVIQSKPLSISAASYRRRVNHVRFRPSLPLEVQEEALVVIVEGLFNRGLIVNYVFPIDDAICCLYEECARYTSLAACSAAVESLIEDGYLVEDPTSTLRPQVSLDAVLPRRTQKRRLILNCRLADIAGVPADALIACDYHRHILSAHIIVEAQNARSGVSESLSRLNTLWHTGAHQHLHEFTRIIVQLQLKSKEAFASRVPEFQLRRDNWTPGDDLLDPDMPSVDQQDTQCAAAINEVLHNYMSRLRRLYPSMLVIEVSPNDPRYRDDPVVASRLQCRYGKVTSSDGSAVVFCPNMYYGVLPISEVMDRHRTTPGVRSAQQMPVSSMEAAESAPITSAGVLVVEVGFQVVHYALDFFVIKGERLAPGIEARIASAFKQNLMFDRAVYDAAVRRYIADIRMPAGSAAAADRPAPQPLSTAITNLAKHHPTPPQYSCSAATPFRITDQNVLRVKSLASSATGTRKSSSAEKLNATFAPPAAHTRGTGGAVGKVTLLSPSPSSNAAMLIHAPTGERYLYGGLIDWDAQTLYVLVTPVRLEVAADYAVEHHASAVANSLMPIIVQAKDLLFAQLLESTQQERVNAAWEKFLYTRQREESVGLDRAASPRHDAPSYDEFELVVRNAHRVLLQSYRPIVQQALEPVEWSGDVSMLRRAQEVLFPDYVLRLIRRSSTTRPENNRSAALNAGSAPRVSSNPSTAVAAGSGLLGAVERGSADHGTGALMGTRTSASAASLFKPTVGGYPLSRLFQASSLPDEFVITFARAVPPSDYFLVIRCVQAEPHDATDVVIGETYLCSRAAPSIIWSHKGAVTVLTGDQSALMDTFVELLANCLWSSIVPHSSQAR